MKKSIRLRNISIIIVTFVQSLISSVVEHKEVVPVIKQFMYAARDGNKEKLKALNKQYDHLITYSALEQRMYLYQHLTRKAYQ